MRVCFVSLSPKIVCPHEFCASQVWMELISQAPQQYVVAASCPWMGAWLCLTMQPSLIPIDVNMLLEVKARFKVGHLMRKYTKLRILGFAVQ